MTSTVRSRPEFDRDVQGSKRSSRRWIVGAVTACLLALTIWLLFFSQLFSARTVEVIGNRQVSATEVLSVADVPADVPLIRVPLDSIAQRVEGLDEVAAVTVERQWPDTVRVVVTERTPVAQVGVGERIGVLGSDGLLYRDEAEALVALPVLDGDWPTGAESMSDQAVPTSVTAAFEVAQSLPPWLRRQVSVIDADDIERIEITLDNDALVQWGSSESGQRKSEVLRLLLPRRAAVFDVSVPDAPAWSG